MNLRDPGLLLVAWVLTPLLIVLVSAALGRGLAAVSGFGLGPLTVPAGFMAGIVAMTGALWIGASATVTVAVACVLAAPGLVLLALDVRRADDLRARARGGLLPAATGLGAYLLGLAPLAGAGRSGVLGYVLNNDPAVHITLIEYLRDRGAEPILAPESSFESVGFLVGGNYPLGGHVWTLFGGVITGEGAFDLWVPTLALAGAVLAMAAAPLLRTAGLGPRTAAVGAVAVTGGFLPYSFIASGAFKEILLAGSLLTAAALFERALAAGPTPRRLLAPVVVGAAGLAAFSFAAAAWLGPAALAALVFLWPYVPRQRLRRPGRRGTIVAGLAALVAVVAAIPVVDRGLAFVSDNEDIFNASNQVGNLVAPVPFWETFNVWFAYDYRYPDPVEIGLTVFAVIVAVLLTAAGIYALARTRPPGTVVVLVGSVVGSVVILTISASIYFEAKALVLIAPAFALAAMAGLRWLWLRSVRLQGLAVFLTVALGAGILASDALVYSGAWVTPEDRLEALADVGERIPAGGPVLLSEREYYGKYLLRDKSPWNSYDEWQPQRAFVWGEIPPSPPHHPDFDDYSSALIQRFPWLIERKRPGASAPPSNFAVAYENEHYRLWRRDGKAPRLHLGLGSDDKFGANLVSSAKLNCRTEQGREFLRAARAGGTMRVSRIPTPIFKSSEGWNDFDALELGPAERFLKRRGGVGFVFPRGMEVGERYRVWIQGSYGPGVRVYLGSNTIGEVFGDVGVFDGWHALGEITVRRPYPTFRVLGLHRPTVLSGSSWNDLTGPLAFERVDQTGAITEMPASRARELCGERLDWVELL